MFIVSDHSELQRTFDRVGLHEPRPLRDGLAHGPWIGARATWSCQRAAHERLTALHDLCFLLLREPILDRSQGEPHRADNGEHQAKLDPQDGGLAIRGARTFAREHRRHEDDGGDFLRPGFDRMTLQDIGLPQHSLRVAKIELVLPARGVQLCEIERRCRPMIQQTRTQAQLVTSKALAPKLDTNLPYFEVTVDPPRPALLPHGEVDESAPIWQLLADPRFDRARHAEEKMTPDA